MLALATTFILAALLVHIVVLVVALLKWRERRLVADATVELLGVSELINHHGCLHFRTLFVQAVVLDFSEDVLNLLFDSLWIELICLYDVRQFTFDIQLVVLFNDYRVKLGDRNLVLSDEHDTVTGRTRLTHVLKIMQLQFIFDSCKGRNRI